jgi:hypothetical protein
VSRTLEPLPDAELLAEREMLKYARRCLVAMRRRTRSLRAAGADPCAVESVEWRLRQRVASLTDDERIDNIIPLPPPEHLIRFFPIQGSAVEAMIAETRAPGATEVTVCCASVSTPTAEATAVIASMIGISIATNVRNTTMSTRIAASRPSARCAACGRCRRGGADYEVSLLDVVLPRGSELARVLAAYRYWAGVDPWLAGATRPRGAGGGAAARR